MKVLPSPDSETNHVANVETGQGLNQEAQDCIEALQNMSGTPTTEYSDSSAPTVVPRGMKRDRNDKSVSGAKKQKKLTKKTVPRKKSPVGEIRANTNVPVSVKFPDFELLGKSGKEICFIKTRHSNIRCFPGCLPVHRPKSFCGKPVEVHLYFKEHPDFNIGKLKVYGGLQPIEKKNLPFSQIFREPPIPDILSASPKPLELDSSDESTSDEHILKFVIIPCRKWRYSTNNNPRKDHVFTVFVCYEGREVFRESSIPFKIIPSWKVDTYVSEETEKKLLKEKAAKQSAIFPESGYQCQGFSTTAPRPNHSPCQCCLNRAMQRQLSIKQMQFQACVNNLNQLGLWNMVQRMKQSSFYTPGFQPPGAPFFYYPSSFVSPGNMIANLHFPMQNVRMSPVNSLSILNENTTEK